MNNTPNLLGCPFCGKTHSLIVGAASEAWDADEHGPYPHTESYAVFCDASTDGRRGGCGGAGGYRLTKDEAIEVWNRRTPQPVVREPLTAEGKETGDSFTVTEEWIHAHKTPAGGWCAAQLKAIGVAWPPRTGWIRDSAGLKISAQAKAAFEGGKVSKSHARKLNREANNVAQI